MDLNEAMRREGEKREKNPFERLITDKSGRGSPLLGDQPRTQRLFMTILIPMLLISTPAVTTAFIEYYILYHGFPT